MANNDFKAAITEADGSVYNFYDDVSVKQRNVIKKIWEEYKNDINRQRAEDANRLITKLAHG